MKLCELGLINIHYRYRYHSSVKSYSDYIATCPSNLGFWITQDKYMQEREQGDEFIECTQQQQKKNGEGVEAIMVVEIVSNTRI